MNGIVRQEEVEGLFLPDGIVQGLQGFAGEGLGNVCLRAIVLHQVVRGKGHASTIFLVAVVVLGPISAFGEFHYAPGNIDDKAHVVGRAPRCAGRSPVCLSYVDGKVAGIAQQAYIRSGIKAVFDVEAVGKVRVDSVQGPVRCVQATGRERVYGSPWRIVRGPAGRFCAPEAAQRIGVQALWTPVRMLERVGEDSGQA